MDANWIMLVGRILFLKSPNRVPRQEVQKLTQQPFTTTDSIMTNILVEQRTPTYGPQPTTSLWPLGHWAA